MRINHRNDGISYEHPVHFWLGVLVTTTGVVLQLPMYWMARHDHFHMYGMPVSTEMGIGMVLIGIGVALVFYAVFPKKIDRSPRLSKIRIGAMDDAKIRKAHVTLLLVLAAAITIDVMKPV